MADTPQYVIRPKVARIVVPNLITTLVLAIVFYLGIIINTSLLNIDVPQSVKLLIMAVLGLLVVMQAFISFLDASKKMYSIYSDRVQIEGPKPKYIMFSAVQDIKIKRNFFDSMFNTGSMTFSPEQIKLVGVGNFDQTLSYIRQMIQYSRAQYNQ